MKHDEDSDKSRVLTWVLCLVAVPVVYLLSVPPLVFAVMRLQGPAVHPPPAWVMAYEAPYSWLMLDTPLRAPLQHYARFWMIVID